MLEFLDEFENFKLPNISQFSLKECAHLPLADAEGSAAVASIRFRLEGMVSVL
jgi:hypothetical protein